MGRKHDFNVNERVDNRRFKPEIVIALLFVFIFLGGLGYVAVDLLRNPDEIDESKNNAILGEVKSDFDEKRTIETASFTMEIPAGWVEINKPEKIYEGGQRYYPYRYQGATGEENGRWVEVYEEEIPLIPINKILGVSSKDNRLIVGDISEQCVSFVDYDKDKFNNNADIESTWEGHGFLCRLSEIGNTIAAIETDMKNGYVLKGDSGDRKFLLVFADHGASEDNSIFVDIVESFRAK